MPPRWCASARWDCRRPRGGGREGLEERQFGRLEGDGGWVERLDDGQFLFVREASCCLFGGAFLLGLSGLLVFLEDLLGFLLVVLRFLLGFSCVLMAFILVLCTCLLCAWAFMLIGAGERRGKAGERVRGDGSGPERERRGPEQPSR